MTLAPGPVRKDWKWLVGGARGKFGTKKTAIIIEWPFYVGSIIGTHLHPDVICIVGKNGHDVKVILGNDYALTMRAALFPNVKLKKAQNGRSTLRFMTLNWIKRS